MNIEYWIVFCYKEIIFVEYWGGFLLSDLLNETRSNIEGNLYFLLKQKMKETQIRKPAWITFFAKSFYPRTKQMEYSRGTNPC